jgi:hypothetical protein
MPQLGQGVGHRSELGGGCSVQVLVEGRGARSSSGCIMKREASSTADQVSKCSRWGLVCVSLRGSLLLARGGEGTGWGGGGGGGCGAPNTLICAVADGV